MLRSGSTQIWVEAIPVLFERAKERFDGQHGSIAWLPGIGRRQRLIGGVISRLLYSWI
jgi:hypothetical protein